MYFLPPCTLLSRFTQLTWCLLYQFELFNLCGVSCVWHMMSILTSMCSIWISWSSGILETTTPFMLYILKKITFTTLYCVLHHLNLHLEITGCSRYFDLSYISGQQLQLLILVQVLHAKFQSSHPGSVLHANSADEPCSCNHHQHSDLSNFVSLMNSYLEMLQWAWASLILHTLYPIAFSILFPSKKTLPFELGRQTLHQEHCCRRRLRLLGIHVGGVLHHAICMRIRCFISLFTLCA